MISRMCFQLKMDRPVVIEGKNSHYISPGGYICGIPFDFFDAEWNRSEEDKSIINVRVRCEWEIILPSRSNSLSRSYR